jgi:ABC-type dipeptide/oligopeptide/nickel transport system permease subunit
MKKRLDALLWVGTLFLLALGCFAAFGPAVRDSQLSVLGTPVRSVYDPVAQPNAPYGTQIAGAWGVALRSGPNGPVIASVDERSQAQAAGLARGLTLRKINGQGTAGQPFVKVADSLFAGGPVELEVSRVSGEVRTLQLTPPKSSVKFGTLPLGADEQGRDVIARLAAGSRISLLVGLLVQGIALVVGITVGVLGVFAPKWIATPLLRFTDGMFAFPDILLAILLVGLFADPTRRSGGESSVLPVVVALSITAWPTMARLVFTQVASLKDREFVVSARAAGASVFYRVTRHILPQMWGILLAVSMIDLAGTILAESTLSFLGIGVQPPDASWGMMINNARLDMNSNPQALIAPCVILSLTIFALNFVGDGLRSYLDPKSK